MLTGPSHTPDGRFGWLGGPELDMDGLDSSMDWIGLGQKFCPLHCFAEDGSAFVSVFFRYNAFFGF